MLKKKQRQKIIQPICFGGCNWDAMMLWMYNDGNAPYIDITSNSPKDICEGTPTRSKNNGSVECITGRSEDDKLANIYDLIGCEYDCGMEASGDAWRVDRGSRFERQLFS